ncbi:hypothetical protein B0H11DRAFT_2373528 [Mycena galericulata]|nr:hypothetical protein B0H11DRAFT_2373528 [Mycena galericulata]
MPHFSKTVSQLTRDELVSAANVFDLDTTGSVTALRARVKAHIDDNEHYMGNANYWHLFTRRQRNSWSNRSPSPTPSSWGGIESETPATPESIAVNLPDSDDNSVLEPPTLVNPSGADISREAQIQLLQSLPPDSLTRALTTLFSNGNNSTHNDNALGLLPTANGSSSNSTRKRPTRTLGLTASSSGALIPEAIRKKISGPDGWKTHVPFQNAGIVKRNRLEVTNNSGTTVYVARKKQVAGDGLALATALAPVNPNVNVPPPQGNAAVGAVFHATIDTHGMNHGMILGLIRFYNEDFGIVPGDTVPTRSQKITNWLTEPMF